MVLDENASTDPFHITFDQIENANLLGVADEEMHEIELTEDDKMETEAFGELFSDEMMEELKEEMEKGEAVLEEEDREKTPVPSNTSAITEPESDTETITEEEMKMEDKAFDRLFSNDYLDKLDKKREEQRARAAARAEAKRLLDEKQHQELLDYVDDLLPNAPVPKNVTMIGREWPTPEQIRNAWPCKLPELCIHVPYRGYNKYRRVQPKFLINMCCKQANGEHKCCS
ncbi:hypothetical protein CAEBREN_24379 [Caenorhabditis brenneri]|uniref:Uncharacterized protein n=1 Tax=Caenorhabditis brenneri TaxID=135651 RepID=G0NZP8_CAEBE|nr:hypothetical protein CAEBREN_24379 [Caenorhabditis brenneri]